MSSARAGDAIASQASSRKRNRFIGTRTLLPGLLWSGGRRIQSLRRPPGSGRGRGGPFTAIDSLSNGFDHSPSETAGEGEMSDERTPPGIQTDQVPTESPPTMSPLSAAPAAPAASSARSLATPANGS